MWDRREGNFCGRPRVVRLERPDGGIVTHGSRRICEVARDERGGRPVEEPRWSAVVLHQGKPREEIRVGGRMSQPRVSTIFEVTNRRILGVFPTLWRYIGRAQPPTKARLESPCVTRLAAKDPSASL